MGTLSVHPYIFPRNLLVLCITAPHAATVGPRTLIFGVIVGPAGHFMIFYEHLVILNISGHVPVEIVEKLRGQRLRTGHGSGPTLYNQEQFLPYQSGTTTPLIKIYHKEMFPAKNPPRNPT